MSKILFVICAILFCAVVWFDGKEAGYQDGHKDGVILGRFQQEQYQQTKVMADGCYDIARKGQYAPDACDGMMHTARAFIEKE